VFKSSSRNALLLTASAVVDIVEAITHDAGIVCAALLRVNVALEQPYFLE
jgi:hypothetical protein